MPRICKIAQMDKLSYRSVGFNRIPDAANLFVRVFQLHVTEIEFPLRGFHVRQDFREILNLLKKSRLSAGEIGDHFSISGAAVSRHLSVLKEADLIRDEREGKFIYYELNTTVLEEIMLWITELKGGNDHDQTT